MRVTNHKVMTTFFREKWQLATAVHDECDDLILCESDKSQGYDCIFFLVMFVCWLELMQHLFAWLLVSLYVLVEFLSPITWVFRGLIKVQSYQSSISFERNTL